MTRPASVVAALASAMILVLAAATPASAAADYDGQQQGDSTVISAWERQPARAERPGRAGGGPVRVWLFLPACEGNDPNAREVSVVGCAGAQAMCARTAAPGDLMFWRFSAVRGPGGGLSAWSGAGGVCLRSGGAPAGAVPAFTAVDLARLPLPVSGVVVQPGGGRTLVNVPTNLYATGGPRVFDTVVLGSRVRVWARPVGWSWRYGDGGRAVFGVPGGAYPDLSTAYTYTRAGRVRVRLVTEWAGTYAVEGGPRLPVDGTATVASPPVDLTVVATRTELVADTTP